MKVTSRGLLRSTGIAAVLGGLLFVVIQPLHPADVLASVTTDAWAVIHYATLAMLTLFVIGVTGIYLRQAERTGWIGLIGYVVLVVGLVLTALGTAIEALVQPLIAGTDPAFVEGMLAMVHGHPIETDLGAIPMLWNAASIGFMGGTLLFGFATFRAGILSRPAAAVFAVGLFAMAPVAGLLGTPRVGAVPIGIGLAWLGYSLWADGRTRATEPQPITTTTPEAASAA
ncbi:MAG TPA: hypothetical protein VHR55_01980 [Candidatus Limnocylindria bacterium]|nr:hypothetical protein [Candidatus Limnocylindria bacterium]